MTVPSLAMLDTTVSDEPIAYLKTGVQTLLHEVAATEFWQVVTDPLADPQLVREIMKQVYLEISSYQPDVIEATIAVIGQFPRSLSAKRIRTMLIHQAEEWDHGEMALRDYVALGGDPAIAGGSALSSTAFNTAAFWRMLAHKREPFAYLGALYLFEGVTPIVSAAVKNALSPGAVPAHAREYLAFHATEDLKHTRIVEHLISEMGARAADKIKFGFDTFLQVYPMPGWWGAYNRAVATIRG